MIRIALLGVVAAVLLFAQGGPAHADWADYGVQVKCDAADKAFEVVAYLHPQPGDETAQKGFKPLPAGRSLRGCRLGKRRVLTQIEAGRGADDQTCGGGGSLAIPSLSVDGVELEDQLSTLNWWCASSDGPAVVRITVKPDGGAVSMTLCTTPESRDGTRHDPHCETKSIDVDKKAKADLALADPATQAAQSATALPPRFDMAQVFAGQKDADGFPICTHWTGEFAWGGQVQPWAYVGGKRGERTPIYSINPEICSRAGEGACDSSAYVLAGDRVDFGTPCGRWTAVQYNPRVRAFPATRGWVETARLYGVQALPHPPLQPTYPLTGEDPLMVAILSGDADTVASLLRAGADPNDTDKSGRPLLHALMAGYLPVAETLLDAGASSDPGIAGWNRVGMSALEMVAKVERPLEYQFHGQAIDPIPQLQLLLKHGAKLEAVDQRGLTPLLRAIGGNNVDVAAFLIDAGTDLGKNRRGGGTEGAHPGGYSPMIEAMLGYRWHHDPTMIRLLLDHGANPDFAVGKRKYGDFDGETLLTGAASKGFAIIVRELLKHGADPTLRNDAGVLPADVARQAGFPKIAELLAEAAAKKVPPTPE